MKITFLAISLVMFVTGCGNSTNQTHPVEQKQNPQAVPEPAPLLKNMRNRLLTSKPEDWGFNHRASKGEVWGIIMEIGYPETLATLVSLRDGNASFYLGSGGGIIGGIGRENVRKAAIDFVAASELHLTEMGETKSFPYPPVGRVRFYALTFKGVLSVEAEEKELIEGKHKLSRLFVAGQEVFTQLQSKPEDKK